MPTPPDLRSAASRSGSGRPRPQRRWHALVATALVAVSMAPLLGTARPADAHAVVVNTSPPAGSQLDSAPSEVVVTFNERVSTEPDSIVVIDADGEVVSGPATVSGTSVSAPLLDDADGWYAVSWWAVSSDGHPVSGAWTFRVGEGDEAAPEGLQDRAIAASRSGDAARWTFYISQWASTLAAALLIGTCLVAMLARGLDRLVPLAMGSASAAVLGSIVAAASNGPYSAVSGSWFEGPASDEYLARAVLAAVVLGLIALTRPRPTDELEPDRPLVARAAPVVLAAAALAVPVMAGHASTEGDQAVAAVSAHLVVAGAWLGAIPALLLLVADRDAGTQQLMARFSRTATWLLAATLVLGAGSVWLLTGGLTNATQSWGWALFAKLALVGVAITAGAWNRWNVVPRLTELPRRDATTAMRIEALALIAVVALSVTLTHNGPPSATADRGPVVIDTVLDDELRLQLIVDPAQVGVNDVHLFVLDGSSMPLPVEELTVTFGSEELGIVPIEQSLSDLAGGHYSGRTTDLGIAGTWQVDVVIRPDAFSQVTLSEDIEIRP